MLSGSCALFAHSSRFVALLACSGSGGPVIQAASPLPTPTTSDASLVSRARAIHERVITIDTHKDIPDNYATPEADPKTMNSQVNLDKMKAGGYDMAFFAVYVGQGARTDSGNAYAKDRALNKFSAIHRMAEQMYPNSHRDRVHAGRRRADSTSPESSSPASGSRTVGSSATT